jgi:hypothetical protein
LTPRTLQRAFDRFSRWREAHGASGKDRVGILVIWLLSEIGFQQRQTDSLFSTPISA